jgi:hypothetical protein
MDRFKEFHIRDRRIENQGAFDGVVKVGNQRPTDGRFARTDSPGYDNKSFFLRDADMR